VKLAKVSIFVAVIACGVLATRAPLHAEPADLPNIAGSDDMPWNRGVALDTRIAARELFLEGNRLFKIPLFSQAVEKYTQAIAQWKHPAFYFNLALAEINLGQYLDAREDLERALEYGEPPLRTDRFREAQNQLVEVQRHLGRIRVSCPTPGAELTLDGAVLLTGPGEREVWVKTGAHEVAAKRPEYATQARRLTVAPGAREPVSLALRKLVEDRPWATWKPWAVIGIGIGVAAGSGLVHTLSARNFSTYDSGFAKLDCAAMGCTQAQIDMGAPHLSARLSRARLEQDIAFGGYVAGGIALAGGVALLYINRPHLMEQEDRQSTGVAIVPVVSTEMFGMAVTVSH
jgi:hypothetical protein